MGYMYQLQLGSLGSLQPIPKGNSHLRPLALVEFDKASTQASYLAKENEMSCKPSRLKPGLVLLWESEIPWHCSCFVFQRISLPAAKTLAFTLWDRVQAFLDELLERN